MLAPKVEAIEWARQGCIAEKFLRVVGCGVWHGCTGPDSLQPCHVSITQTAVGFRKESGDGAVAGQRTRSSSVKDVAAVAGVSLGTVSNVLNRPERVSVRTRDKVEQAMRELGFVRNESARQLRAGKSRVLAYVMLDASNPFFTDVAQGIEEVAEGSDLSLFICNSDQRG